MAGIRIPWQGWTVIRKIGEGSYGAVYEIERMIGDMKEKAALKIMSIPKSQDEVESARAYGYDDKSIARRYEEDFNRILKEYQVMMSMKGHSNIVSCEDIYKEQRTKGIGWRVYIRMEYLTPLLTYKQNQLRNTFDESTVRKVAADMCNALALCEQKHIVHRDIKPENIMVSEYGSFKLGDFGIARTMDHTTTATSIGSKLYMAPEAIKGEQYNQTVDIYSLGMVLYWMCNNYKLPFWPQDRVPDYDTAQQAYNRRIRGDVLPMPVNGSPQLKKFVMKACAYKPGDRYQTAREMLDVLQGMGTSENRSRSSTSSLSSAFSGQVAKTETLNAAQRRVVRKLSAVSEQAAKTETSTIGWSTGSGTSTSGLNSGSGASSSAKTEGNSWKDTEETMGAVGWGQSSPGGSSGVGSKTTAAAEIFAEMAEKTSTHQPEKTAQKKGGIAKKVIAAVLISGIITGVLKTFIGDLKKSDNSVSNSSTYTSQTKEDLTKEEIEKLSFVKDIYNTYSSGWDSCIVNGSDSLASIAEGLQAKGWKFLKDDRVIYDEATSSIPELDGVLSSGQLLNAVYCVSEEQDRIKYCRIRITNDEDGYSHRTVEVTGGADTSGTIIDGDVQPWLSQTAAAQEAALTGIVPDAVRQTLNIKSLSDIGFGEEQLDMLDQLMEHSGSGDSKYVFCRWIDNDDEGMGWKLYYPEAHSGYLSISKYDGNWISNSLMIQVNGDLEVRMIQYSIS